MKTMNWRRIAAMVATMVLSVTCLASAQAGWNSRSSSSCTIEVLGSTNQLFSGTYTGTYDIHPIGVKSEAGIVGWSVSCVEGFSQSGSFCFTPPTYDGPGGWTDARASAMRVTSYAGQLMTWHKHYYGTNPPGLTKVGDYTRSSTCPQHQCPPDITCSGTPILVPTRKALDKDKLKRQYRISGAEKGVAFDLNGDGTPEVVGWPEKNDVAFLAIDDNENGYIDSGKELLGDANGNPNGFAELLARAQAIKETAGALDATHPLFAKLLLWTDANRDGFSQPDELEPASSRLTKIGLGWETLTDDVADANGNIFRVRGWAEFVDPENPNAKIDKGDYVTNVFPIWDVILVKQ